MNANVQQQNSHIMELARKLAILSKDKNTQPCPRVPRSRSYAHFLIEQTLDEGMFIYGGFVCDPSE